MGTKKRPVKVFSGPTTSDLTALDRGLSRATAVRVYEGGCLVYAVRPDEDVLSPETEKWVSVLDDQPIARTQDAEAVAELRTALRVAQTQDWVCMCPGELALEFLDDSNRPVEVVRFDSPDAIKWNGWSGSARLTDPPALRTWLSRHGVTTHVERGSSFQRGS